MFSVLGTIAIWDNHANHEKSVLDFQRKKTPTFTQLSNPLNFKFQDLKLLFIKLLDFSPKW